MRLTREEFDRFTHELNPHVYWSNLEIDKSTAFDGPEMEIIAGSLMCDSGVEYEELGVGVRRLLAKNLMDRLSVGTVDLMPVLAKWKERANDVYAEIYIPSEKHEELLAWVCANGGEVLER